MNLFLTNLLLAFLWGSAQGLGLDTLGFGFVLGMAVLRMGLPLYPKQEPYFRRVFGFLRFVFVFVRELVLSTVSVARVVILKSPQDLHPNLLTLDTRGMNGFEVLMLSQCITLTPGTCTVMVGPGKEWILVHALEGQDAQGVRQGIESTLKEAILRFTR
jgi:multicomponent Na+:H+ antiporter subunit E